ncbi:MAG: DUF3685 domain-containing protein, partial [Cyanobacteria bacterium K_Offshore_0m_m2_072]|nr:DUF3685 domain-containing protein [Cyanobacteria bacterium K_Offshore_0m_m2_072]
MAQHLLLLAEPLLAEGVRRVLADTFGADRIVGDPEALKGTPQLVLWFPTAGIDPGALEREARRLSDTWQPAALLIALPHGLAMARQRLLMLPAEGLLLAPGPDDLLQAIQTVI